MNTILPISSESLIPDMSQNPETHQTSYTFNLDYGGDGQVKGFCDELAAMRQAIYKIINTERYQYPIYSWDYGIELADLFGKPIPYVYAELQCRITEALMTDDRINSVTGFEFSNSGIGGGDVLVKFNVDTIFGTISAQKEVTGVV